ncbi:MAG: ISAs1 family transposase [Planctomycetia bacterium]|nr:ISAs1 family transposase [Planctomycetia bacterium]
MFGNYPLSGTDTRFLTGPDYLVTVKGNQPQLLRDVEQAFVIPRSFSPYQERETLAQQQTVTTVEKNRGRIETRTVTTTTATIDEQYLDWPGAKQLIRLERHTLERHTVEKGQTRRSTTYAITSLSRTRADAAFLLKHLGGRWQIENRCFYVLDTVLGDDASRSRTGNAGRALHGIRLATLNLARRLSQSVGSLCREHALKLNLLLNRLRIFKN